MDFSPSARAAELTAAVREFIAAEIEPVERRLRRPAGAPVEWRVPDEVRELQRRARERGLWNLFEELSNVDYAPIAEATGWSFLAPYVFNCNAPDTGNMEVLARYGTPAQQEQWLTPLRDGVIRSGFAMTEPGVASSDATNMQLTAVLDGDGVVLDGRKWWTTGVGHPDCRVLIVMGLTDPEAHRHARHSMVLVPIDTPGVTVERMLDTMGFLDEPFGHGEVSFTGVRVPAANIIAGPGQAFAIAQGRLGPGRVHHAMRMIGLAERALHLACERGLARTAFGKPVMNLGGNRERVADARIAINSTRLLIQHAAWKLDTGGPLAALSEVSQIKVAAPNVAQQVIDFAMQIHGGAGLSSDFPLAAAWTAARAVRIADGPDEVHRGLIARIELAEHGAAR
ncbi:putative acyl-CoA dehydrogenase [Actinoplanes philippinensis]|uniref:Acyl-CoA dehydrogenase n=1 Tax=Actinoplanes philippinensis TaxID=35752 RepID=A0A1I2LIC3_9ACTN|nr:acyl-CoA dehydrogenase family protein [Actinoplanes philippinensis]GIE80551.1 putative acyl-CoA dehydrogenase [Actinoplanes philippinensis]SFF77197.1 acyl-CoA dehydrogenase [Actinoplanes philippinensis]